MRVLHLEDSDPDAELVVERLSNVWPNIQMRRAMSRNEYQTALDTGEYDLILSDYTLHGFDGLSALDLARAHCPETPFIFLSGTIGEERAIEALRRGATDYVIKDRPSRLLPAIRQAIDHASEEKRLRQTEDALRQNRERFRQITENVADLIVMIDLTGRCLYCNPAYDRAVGRSGDVGSCDVFAHIHPDDREAVRELFRSTIHSGEGSRGEYRLVHEDGAIRYVEAQNSVVRDSAGAAAHVLVVARDVTERRAAEERIRRQAALLDRAQDAILTRDMDDRITYWNESATRIYGWTATEAMSRPAAELWTEDADQIDTARRATLFYGEWMGEVRQRSRAGTELLLQSRWSLIQTPEGNPAGFLVINTDIAEKKRLEAQFLRVQRAESIGLLAGGVAHDINNVLVPIVIAADLLEPVVTDEDSKTSVTTIRASAQHGVALVKQLLAFARGAIGQHTELDLAALTKDFLAFAKQTFARGIELVLAPTEALPPIRGDATQIKQVLLNLCLNARDAMSEGGRIAIELKALELDDAAATALREIKAGAYIRLTVTDNGTGMPPGVLERIFDPFFTTKEVGKGTGLGLSAVRGIVKGHHGTITVESQAGRGTSFHIYLPVAAPIRVSTPVVPQKSSATPFGMGECVLLVDDQAWVRDVLGSLLVKSGYRVIKASSGSEGLSTIDRHGSEISLVLTDMTMAHGDGLEFIRELRKRGNQLPVIAMSGLAGSNRFDRELRQLGVPLLAKPINRETLVGALRSALGQPATV